MYNKCKVFFMKLINTSTYEIKKSKFIAYYYQIDSKEEAEQILINIKKEHKKARHIPYAYKICSIVKKSDDKEPSGTAGSPIYQYIEREKLDNILLVVVRYFGGIKLGAGGLLRAYSNAIKEVLK